MTIESQIRLLTWLSPAFPTGAYAYSHGLEWAADAGDITDEATLSDWLHDILLHGAGRNDAILLRHAHRTTDLPALVNLAHLAAASAGSRERALETLSQGAAFVLAAAAWPCNVLTHLHGLMDGRLAYPVALGVLGRAYGIEENLLTAAAVQAFAANLISAALRLAPIGQAAGLRVLAGLEQCVAQVIAETQHADLEQLGSACFRLDIAAMKHETQYTRLFRS